MLPEHQIAAPAELPFVTAVPAPPLSPAPTDAVDRILAYTETAVASIVRRTEHQVREIAAEADARTKQDAIERCARLAELRRELTDRASALAVHYEALLDQLEAVEKALAIWGGQPGDGTLGGRPGDPRVSAIKMTLRERQRISVAYEEAPSATVHAMPQAPPPPTPIGEQYSRRRWWRPWAA